MSSIALKDLALLEAQTLLALHNGPQVNPSFREYCPASSKNSVEEGNIYVPRFQSSIPNAQKPSKPGPGFEAPLDLALRGIKLPMEKIGLVEESKEDTEKIFRLPKFSSFDTIITGKSVSDEGNAGISHTSSAMTNRLTSSTNSASSSHASLKPNLPYPNSNGARGYTRMADVTMMDRLILRKSSVVMKKSAGSSRTPIGKVSPEEIKAERAKRNRESAKRSRLKSKMNNQRVFEKYEALKKENEALKLALENLLKPENTKAPLRVLKETVALLQDYADDSHGEFS